MNKLVIVLIIVSVFVSCVNKNTSQIDQKRIIMKDSIDEQEIDLENYYTVFEESPTVEEINQGLPMIEKLLIENQFRFLPKEKYKNRVKEIFDFDFSLDCYNRVVNFNSFYIYSSPKRDSEKGTLKTEIIKKNNQMALDDSENILFVKDKSYITPLFYLIEFTDSKYKNPKLISTIIHRNKYLFNDSNASLTWLMNNDSIFVESLVLYFGYTQDKKILKWTLDKNKFYYTNLDNNLENFTRVLANRRCDGKLVFNKEVLDIMTENLNKEYFDQIIDFIRYYGIDNNNSNFTSTITFSEKVMLIAHLLHWGESLSQEEKYSDYMFKFMGAFYKWSKDRNDYDDEFKKQGYYGLKNFKELWEEAKENGDGTTNYAM